MTINWLDPQIWILASFLLFVLGVGMPIIRKVKSQLDNRSHIISRQVREVADLYQETLVLLEKQKQEFKNMYKIINAIKIETEQEVMEITKHKDQELSKIKSLHNDRIEKQIRLIKEQYIKDVLADSLNDIMGIVQYYVENNLSTEDIHAYNGNKINALSFVARE
jgi:F0F1-type ATP synthase membrane subunit b/b'